MQGDIQKQEAKDPLWMMINEEEMTAQMEIQGIYLHQPTWLDDGEGRRERGEPPANSNSRAQANFTDINQLSLLQHSPS